MTPRCTGTLRHRGRRRDSELTSMMPDPVGNWDRLGRPGWPPHDVKARVVLEMAERYGLKTLVETGTYAGDMIMSVCHCFDKVYSIEINANMYRENVERFNGLDNLEIICGDSPEVLRARAKDFLSDGPALFWLDAHSPDECALMRELEVLLPLGLGKSVILADDMRLMTYTTAKWPDVGDILDVVADIRPEWIAVIEDDVLRVTPPMTGGSE